MKKYILLLPLAALAIWLTACSGSSTKPGCRIEGENSFKEYQTAYLVDNSGKRTDSCEIKDGHFTFEINRDIKEPYIVTIHMAAEQDPLDQLDMPIAIENGTVEIGLDEYIKLSGTPLNNRIKEFLDALQHCKDGVISRKMISPEEVTETFSQFYKQQILSNKDNALARYIFDNYGVHLNATDKEQVKAQIGN